jgi:hypothetical protein
MMSGFVPGARYAMCLAVPGKSGTFTLRRSEVMGKAFRDLPVAEYRFRGPAGAAETIITITTASKSARIFNKKNDRVHILSLLFSKNRKKARGVWIDKCKFRQVIIKYLSCCTTK